MTYQSINPNTGKLLKSFGDLTGTELEQSLAKAESCFQTWKHTSYAHRAAIVNKAAALMAAHVDDFAKLATLEMGKRIDEARGEVKFSSDILAYYAKHGEAFLKPTILHPKHGEAHMESSPFGVIFCVEPWNFPYYQLARIAGADARRPEQRRSDRQGGQRREGGGAQAAAPSPARGGVTRIHQD